MAIVQQQEALSAPIPATHSEIEEQQITLQDIDSKAPTSNKTSSLGHLVNSSCVDREKTEKSYVSSWW